MTRDVATRQPSELQAVSVGSVPAGFLDPGPDALATYTRLTRCDAAAASADPGAEPPFIAEWRSLAAREAYPCANSAPKLVRKAQLPGPITLLYGGFTDLRDSFRSLPVALETLLDAHPDLDELWLDEPMLCATQSDRVHLLEKTLRALRAEFFGLRFGVHTCNAAPWAALLRANCIDVLHVDAQRYGADVADAIAHARAAGETTPEIVWGLVPTNEATPSDEELLASLASLRSRAGDEREVARLSTTCGLGLLSADQASERFATLRRLERAAAQLS